MKSIGLVGVNTSHADAFTRIFNGSADESPRIDSARITDAPSGLPSWRRRLGHTTPVSRIWRT